MPSIRIVSLGEVVPQQQMKALMAFATVISPGDPKAAQSVLGKILLGADTYKDLSDFKEGTISEETFTANMITRIKDATTVELTPEQFDTAWNAMNPAFAEFSASLGEVLRENRGDQKIILISYTNSKDMRHLRNELDAAGTKYTLDENGEFSSIEGMPLHLSYTAKKTKADLILQVIQQMVRPPSVTLFGSAPQSQDDIKYVRSISGEKDPIFNHLHEESHKTVVDAAEQKGVATLFWNKQKGQSFNEAIHESQAIHLVPAAKL